MRQNIPSGSKWEPLVGYSRAVRMGNHVHVSGTTASDPEGCPLFPGDPGAQTREILRRIAGALAAAGAGLSDVVRTRIFVTDITRWEEVGRVHGEVFGVVRPACTLIEVSGLIDPSLMVEIEAEAVIVPPANPRPG
jgi:enamine deaminase RidA (YjgF/YER057c/UK114 family)